jgi:hypothetical protein
MDISKPILTEPGVKYFLKETLKNCKIKKDTEFNKIINLALLTCFIVISCGLLYYKYKTRPTPEDRNKSNQLKKVYFINKVKQKKKIAVGFVLNRFGQIFFDHFK